jgi:hypothetical protein
MRLPIPFGRKGLIAAAAIAAGVVYWRVRVRRQEAADREWDEDVQSAIQDGVAAGHAATTRGEPVETPSA